LGWSIQVFATGNSNSGSQNLRLGGGGEGVGAYSYVTYSWSYLNLAKSATLHDSASWEAFKVGAKQDQSLGDGSKSSCSKGVGDCAQDELLDE
jgi:hypothetical protein